MLAALAASGDRIPRYGSRIWRLAWHRACSIRGPIGGPGIASRSGSPVQVREMRGKSEALGSVREPDEKWHARAEMVTASGVGAGHRGLKLRPGVNDE